MPTTLPDMDESFATSTKSLAQELAGLTSLEQLDEAQRFQLTAALEQVQRAVEPPNKFMQSLTQGANGLTAARVAIAMGIFDAFVSGGCQEMTTEELHLKTIGDSLLLERIMRLLASNGLAQHTGLHQWRLTPVGSSMTKGSISAMMIIHFYDQLKVRGCLLDFLKTTDFRNPDDHFNGPWQFAYETEQSYFEWMRSGDKLRQDSFNTVMKINQQYRGQNWFEYYPVEDRTGDSPHETLLVDIGGGLGHDALAFRTRFPDSSGRVVLQDLPHVVSEIEGPLPPNFAVQAYDAFTAQPIRGAKIYYLRTVLHDFPDTQALQMLRNIRDAMDQHSILLINENLMPEDEISAIAVDVDFIMMNCLASLERTEMQWRGLIKAAGFRVANVWRPTERQMSPHALFEAALP